jgi:hypothetical protein
MSEKPEHLQTIVICKSFEEAERITGHLEEPLNS